MGLFVPGHDGYGVNKINQATFFSLYVHKIHIRILYKSCTSCGIVVNSAKLRIKACQLMFELFRVSMPINSIIS